jgi:hypothetical protein
MKAKPTILSPPWMLTAITRLKSGDDLMSRLTWIICRVYPGAGAGMRHHLRTDQGDAINDVKLDGLA